MVRFQATDGPLRFAAVASPRGVLLCFDIDETADGIDLRAGLVGFVLKREQLVASGASPFPAVWIGDKRRALQAQARAPPSPARPEAEGGEAAEAPSNGRLGGWQHAVRNAICDFKWGDYKISAETSYRYTLYAVCGDSQLSLPSVGVEEPPDIGPGLHAGARVSLCVTTPTLYGGAHEVHFNRGVTGSQRFAHLFPDAKESGPRTKEQWQWLSRGLEEALLHFLAAAKGPGWRICGALYEAHYMPVLRALAEARERGAQVSLIVDWKVGMWSEDKRMWVQRGPQHLNAWALEASGLLEAGCVVKRTRPISAISHNKFFVLVSPEEKAVAVWTGSTNITSGAIFGHSNVGHVVRDGALCQKYLEYWTQLRDDPEKKRAAAFNEEHTPLPSAAGGDGERGGLQRHDCLPLFAPRLNWAAPLDFFSQLVRSAKQCVAFTAAFGISKELAPALMGSESVPTYLLMESEGNWAASRDAVRELQAKRNVRVVFGSHLPTAPSKGSGWLPEMLTGLNSHVHYIHTKVLLVDPFSDDPVVVSGSANFSKASMESNDENVVVIRGDRDVADAYAIEFFRIFEHMRFRNALESEGKKSSSAAAVLAEGAAAVTCRCGEAVGQFVVKKEGPNQGRAFRTCAKPRGKACGFFVWLDDEKPLEQTREPLPWPQCAFEGEAFEGLERNMLGQVTDPAHRAGPTAAAEEPSEAAGGERPWGGEEASRAVGLLEEEQESSPSASAAEEQPAQLLGMLPPTQPCQREGLDWGQRRCQSPERAPTSPSLNDAVDQLADDLGALHLGRGRSSSSASRGDPGELKALALQSAYRLLEVDSAQKGGGGTGLYRTGLRELISRVQPLQEPARRSALDLLDAMNRGFVASRRLSWKPYLVRVLHELGEAEVAVDQVIRQYRLLK